MKTLDVEQHII